MLPDMYGCVVANRFGDLLDDEADPFDAIKEVTTDKDKKKKKKKKEEEEKKSKQKKPGQRESQRDRRVPLSSKVSDPPPICEAVVMKERGDGAQEDHRGTKRAAVDEHRTYHEFSYKANSDFRGRGGMRGGRGARGGGGYMKRSDIDTQSVKRECDRHSGTGMSPVEKRGGRGSWNWGSADEPAGELTEATPDVPVQSKDPQSADGDDPVLEEADGEMIVQVAMEMSLDEWKAMQEMSRPKIEFNIRKAEDKIPSKATVIHKSKNMENARQTDDSEEGTFLRRSVNDITSLLNINFGNLGRPSRGGRGRGMRGGAAGRPERVAEIKEEQDHPLAPNPDDPDDFPALSIGR